MESNFNLQEHIAKGVERIVADMLKATLRDPRESAFMVRFAAVANKATRRRLELEAEGLHVPSFLIASITSACNLHCARVLLPLQQRHGGRGAGEAAEHRRMESHLHGG